MISFLIKEGNIVKIDATACQNGNGRCSLERCRKLRNKKKNHWWGNALRDERLILWDTVYDAEKKKKIVSCVWNESEIL